MRVLLLPGLNKSHLYVMVPLAWALRSAGHDVLVAAQPDMAGDIAPTGLPGIAVGPPLGLAAKMARVDPAAGPPSPSSPAAADRPRPESQAEYGAGNAHAELVTLANFFSMLCPDPTVDELVDLARRWRPDLVVWNTMAMAGPVVARACGAAHVRMLFGTDGLAQLRAANRSTDDPVRAWLEPRMARHGCDFAEEDVLGDWTIDPMPCWVWRPEGVRGLRVRPTAFNGPSTVPSWAYDPPERKRVCLTLGLSQRATGTAASDTAELLDAMADLDAEVIATLDPAQLGESATVPGNVRLVDFVPLNALLPSCAAIVHHGGTGTFASAYEHAVPQLVVPRIFWSVKWWGPVAQALGLERRGAGAYVADADQLTAVALHDRLAQVLNDESYARNAASLRDELEATPTPRDLARTLEKLIPEGVAR